MTKLVIAIGKIYRSDLLEIHKSGGSFSLTFEARARRLGRNQIPGLNKKLVGIKLLTRGRAVAARRAHNPEVGGSNPPPATKKRDFSEEILALSMPKNGIQRPSGFTRGSLNVWKTSKNCTQGFANFR